MLARIRKSMETPDKGFTLIELLVVMIIIGILATIAIPTFLNQRKNGYRAAVKSDLRNAISSVESWAVDNGGVYNGATPLTTTVLNGTGFKSSGPVTVTVSATPAVSANAYCIVAQHGSLGTEKWQYLKGQDTEPVDQSQLAASATKCA